MVAQLDPGPLAAKFPLPHFHNAQGLTVRDVVRTSIGGQALRIRLSNRFGNRPVTFDDVRVALSAGRAATVAASQHRVLFGARRRVTIPVGSQRLSDPIALPVGARRDLAITLYSSGPTGRVTGGGIRHPSYLSGPGNFTTNSNGAPFTDRALFWYFLSGVDVETGSRPLGSVVALGDSITAGAASTVYTWRAWVDHLAARLAKRPRPLAVLNAGINGNSLHESSPCFGQSGLARLTRDVFGQLGIRTMILALGVNDIVLPPQGQRGPCAERPVSVPTMIRLYTQVAQRAHAHHLKIIAATITPFGLDKVWTPALEAKRDALNDWIRHAQVFDGVIDFAKALADPADPAKMRAQFSSPDGLHPNDAGHAAMARAIPPRLLAP